MTDFINKLILIFLIFILGVIAPLLINYQTEEMQAKHAILNDIDVFIDKACDATVITNEDLNAFFIQCNSHGLVVDVKVERYVYALTIDDSTSAEKQYTYDYIVDNQYTSGDILLNPKDMIKVTVEEKSVSSSRRLLYEVLRIDEGAFKVSLAGMVG